MKKNVNTISEANTAFTTTTVIRKKSAKKAAPKKKSAKKTTTRIEVAPTIASTLVNPNDSKNAKHNKKFPLIKISRSEMVGRINASGGRFFTSTHIDTTGNARTMNCIKSNTAPTALGMLTVYSMMDKDYRVINPQTLTELSINKTHYYTGKKPK